LSDKESRHIYLKNQLTTSPELSFVKFILSPDSNQTQIYRNDQPAETVETSAFLKSYQREFSHPIFQENWISGIDTSSTKLTLHYNSTQELLTCVQQMIYGFILGHPKLLQIDIKPSSKYKYLSKRAQIPFKLLPNKTKVDHIEISSFNKLCNYREQHAHYKYGEGFIVEQSYTYQDLPENLDFDELIASAVLPEELAQPFDEPVYLKLINKEVGFGCYAIRKIHKGETVCFYNGEYFKKDVAGLTPYSFNARKDVLHDQVDSDCYGNLSRFVNHAYNKNIDDYCKKHDLSVKEFAPENLKFKHLAFGGIGFIKIYAIQDIEPNEQLLFNYGKSYWVKHENANLFKLTDEIYHPSGDITPPVNKMPPDALRLLAENGEAKAFFTLMIRPVLCFLLMLTLTYMLNVN
jgi:hypothetical protein